LVFMFGEPLEEVQRKLALKNILMIWRDIYIEMIK
jgi:hypothetical protein